MIIDRNDDFSKKNYPLCLKEKISSMDVHMELIFRLYVAYQRHRVFNSNNLYLYQVITKETHVHMPFMRGTVFHL
jgi:hypothetical protein